MTSTSFPSATLPTGRREERDGQPHLVLTRTFRAPAEDVWRCVTEADRLARWIGTWRGDPSTGRVEFSMTFDHMPFEPYVIEVCEPPRRLRVHTENEKPQDDWTLDVRLSEQDGTTTLELAQLVDSTTDAADVGPGWEYQLDRLEAAVRGEDATAVTFGERYTSLAEGYGRAFA